MTDAKPRIAIHNLHKLPNLTNWKIHNYAIELVKRGHIQYLYFDEHGPFTNLKSKISLLNKIRTQYGYKGLGLNNVKFIFTEKKLNEKVDILLNFNSAYESEFTPAVKQFAGIKIFHLMDYFWVEPASAKNERLIEYGVDYLMNYGRPDKHCAYFQNVFPTYKNRVIPVPFGFNKRFQNTRPFAERSNKCVALGSVNPLRPKDVATKNYEESASFYMSEEWFHKFRGMIVENLDQLDKEVDSMLPVFPAYKDASYDIVAKLNQYKMFTCCESIFNFPAAKAFEGPACGTAMVCSTHPCFTEYGFKDGENCVTHREYDTVDLQAKIRYYQANPSMLEGIAKRGYEYVTKYYTHEAIADNLANIYTMLYEHTKKSRDSLNFDKINFWPKVSL